ncbi:MAG: biotin/lipoyl-binding protein [Proteobacteria bacterium]|nr:biotin/lipoyl-binding protein [Pseudomonadota bacterium]
MDYTLESRGETVTAAAERTGPDRFTANVKGKDYAVTVLRVSDFELRLTVDQGGEVLSHTVFVGPEPGGKCVVVNGVSYSIRDLALERDRPGRKKGLSEGPGKVTPPMPAVVKRILVKEGDLVEKGDPVIVVSAMKMEASLGAPYRGQVEKINVKLEDKVSPGQILVDITPMPEQGDEA